MPPLTDPLSEKVEPWLSFLCLCVFCYTQGYQRQDSKEGLDEKLVEFRGGQVTDMERLGDIPLSEPGTLEVDVLTGPSLLGTLVEKVNDDTLLVHILKGVSGPDVMSGIERPEERGDTVVVGRAHLRGSVHMMNDGMNELDKGLESITTCLLRIATQCPLEERVLGVRYVPECDRTVSIEDFHHDLVVSWASDTSNLALCSPHRIHSGSETFVEVDGGCGETETQDFIGRVWYIGSGSGGLGLGC